MNAAAGANSTARAGRCQPREFLLNAALDALIGTNSVEAQPIFAAGRLNACTMVFDAFAKDFTYKQGGYVKINGSFGLWNAKGQLGITLKVVLHDLDPRR